MQHFEEYAKKIWQIINFYFALVNLLIQKTQIYFSWDIFITS